MSYDLVVYAERAVSSEILCDLVLAGAGLSVDDASDASVTVVRGARRRYCFTVDGPDRTESEDVPDDVIAVLLDPRWQYTVTAEASDKAEIDHAARFARRLARMTDGAVVDEQTNRVWSRSRSRHVQRPPAAERIDMVHMQWLCLTDQVVDEPAAVFLDVIRSTIPEALPRRFGEWEPLQGRWVHTGSDGFRQAWSAATGSLFIKGTMPSAGGRLDPPVASAPDDPTWGMSLNFFAEQVRTPQWRDALQTLFIRLADELHAFYAAATLEQGWIWSGRSLAADDQTQSAIQPLRWPQGWTGLPPGPTCWTWLGEPFAGHHSALPKQSSTQTRHGMLYTSAPDPLGSLTARPLSHWLPAGLFSSLAPNDPDCFQLPVPLNTAQDIPPRLRRLYSVESPAD